MAKSISEWDERYRKLEQTSDLRLSPTPLVVETAQQLTPGRALDLACGTGRNALWLARQGWATSAIDGSAVAVTKLRSLADELGLKIDTSVADLTRADFQLEEAQWDLILMCYYLQRDLFPQVKKAVVPGGIVIAIVHRTDPGESPSETRLPAGELMEHFAGWQILHSREGSSADTDHRRSVAEIVAKRP